MTVAVATWDGLDAAEIAARFYIPRAEVLAETESTLDDAHALAEQGAAAGTLILADAQRAGRGRMGRSWSSHPGRGVWCTVIERPRDPSALDVLSLRVGLYVAEALDRFCRSERSEEPAVQPRRRSERSEEPALLVKWPNDLMLGDRKLGGILVETRWQGSTLAWVAIGVGVNVIAPPDVPEAAGLRAGTPRVDALLAIVPAIRKAAARTGELTPDELARYASRDALAGRQIVSPGTGVARGLAASGALLVETPAGLEQHRTGTIRFAEAS
jgi:BirA family transcriptional regulator, biotin operon repressor / biotin---[acetyl-CoA-carboxylase] ligase